MRILLYAIVLSITLTGTCFAGSSFLDFLNNPGVTEQPQQQYHQGQGLVCQNCGFSNKPGSTYCAGCGQQLQSSNAVYVNCPHCGRNNVIEVKFCPYCGIENPINGNFCLKCGKNITMPKYMVNCQYCGNQFSFTTNAAQQTIRCPNCNRYYEAGLEECPYCNDAYNDDHNRHDRKKKHGDDQDDDGKRKKRDSHQPSGMVLVNEFTKTSSGQEGKKYDISGHTSNRSYSKVIISCHIISGGISVNTIFLRNGSQDSKFPVASQLKEGRNEFSVPIPQGANFLTISFQSSGNIQVKVYME